MKQTKTKNKKTFLAVQQQKPDVTYAYDYRRE